jgi:CO/xanthine dehydrogenase FAD-binding subunit
VTASYLVPRTLAEAEIVLTAPPAGLLVLAGGTDVMVRNREALRERPVLDVTRVAELSVVALEGDTLVLGAGVTYGRCLTDPLIRRAAPLLGEVARRFASPAIRHAATLGGNVVNASPAADGVAALWAMDAVVDAWTPAGRRQHPVDLVVVGPGRVALPAGSLVTGLRLPVAADGEGAAFYKLVNRAHPEHPMAISVASVAVRLRLDDAGCVTLARVVLGAVAPTPVRAAAAEAVLVGHRPGPGRLEAAAAAAAEAARPIDDVRASAAYRRDVLPALARVALERAATRAQGRAPRG